MTRAPDAKELTSATFDLLVVGGGVHGAFAAWDAALRGLRVALVERGDFGGGTSSNSLKIAHGGLRYLQTGDLRRVRESVRERAILMRAAPHLVRPLCCVMPLLGASLAKRSAFTLALALNDLLSLDRNAKLPPDSRIGRSGLLSRAEYRSLASSLAIGGASAGVLWFDALLESPERLIIGVVRAAAEAGAVVANYADARTLLRDGDRVTGARIRLADGDLDLDIHARLVLVTAGPWLHDVLASARVPAPRRLVRAANVVLRRAPTSRCAVALPHPTERRMLFAVPWRGHLMLGTSYVPHREGATADGDAAVTALVGDFNTALPEQRIEAGEIALVHSGLLPASGGDGGVRLAHRPRLVDHDAAHGIRGLVSLHGVKWTTARGVAERAVDLCQQRLGQRVSRGGTDRRPVANDDGRGAASLDTGTGPSPAAPLVPGADVTAAQVRHAIHEEWALHLTDIVMRRIELGTAGYPGDEVIEAVASVAAAELGWSPNRRMEECAAVRALFPAPA